MRKSRQHIFARVLGKNWIAVLTFMGALFAKTLSSTNWFITTYADKPYVDERFTASIRHTDQKFDEAMRAIDASSDKLVAHSDKNKADMLTEIKSLGAQVSEMEIWLHERIADRREQRKR